MQTANADTCGYNQYAWPNKIIKMVIIKRGWDKSKNSSFSLKRKAL